MQKTRVCKPVYELQGALKGRGVVVVAPGPSLADFPTEGLTGLLTLAVNSAVELIPEPALWMYADKKFTYKYRVPLRKGVPPRVLVARHQLGLRRWFPGEIIWYYEWQHPVKRYQPKESPWWLLPARNYLPGHCSVLSNVLSFCELTKASPVILVGIDFQLRGDQYYAPGVKWNKGPAMQERALNSGLNWLKAGLSRELWPSLDIYTTNHRLSSLLATEKIKRISPELVLGIVKNREEGGILRKLRGENGEKEDS